MVGNDSIKIRAGGHVRNTITNTNYMDEYLLSEKHVQPEWSFKVIQHWLKLHRIPIGISCGTSDELLKHGLILWEYRTNIVDVPRIPTCYILVNYCYVEVTRMVNSVTKAITDTVKFNVESTWQTCHAQYNPTVIYDHGDDEHELWGHLGDFVPTTLAFKLKDKVVKSVNFAIDVHRKQGVQWTTIDELVNCVKPYGSR